MDKIINFELLKHPMNWIIVVLMIFIAGLAVHLFLTWTGAQQGSANS